MSMAAACCLLQDPSMVVGTASAVVLAVFELLLAAVTLLRIFVVVGVALVARLLPCQGSAEPCLYCMGYAKGHAAHDGHHETGCKAGSSTGPQQGIDRSCLSCSLRNASACSNHVRCTKSARVKTCSEDLHAKGLEQHYLASEVDCCSPMQHTLPEDGNSMLAPKGAADGGCPCKPSSNCSRGSAGPYITLSEVQRRNTPQGMSLQLHLTVEAAGMSSPHPCTGRDSSPPPGPSSEAWAVVEELQHEVEEERRAAEVAAAEALKMISRLQSEKAGLEARLRAGAQAEVEASLQRAATLDVLEEVVAQLDAERTALQHENARHRECLARTAGHWQAGCAGFVLLEPRGRGGSGRGGTALQRHRTLGLLEGRSMDLLLTNGMDEAGVTLEKRETDFECKNVCGPAFVASMRPGVLSRLPNGWCGRGQGSNLPASPPHERCSAMDKGLKKVGTQSRCNDAPDKGEGGVPAQEQRVPTLGHPCPLPLSPVRECALGDGTPGDSEGASSSSSSSRRQAPALQRHLSLALHSVVDDSHEMEGVCGMGVDMAKEHPCHTSDGDQADHSEKQAVVVIKEGVEPMGAEASLHVSEGEVTSAANQSPMVEAWGGEQRVCDGGAAAGAVDLGERALGDGPHPAVGGCSSPASGLSPKIALMTDSTPLASEAGELAGKLASRRKWEQQWQDKGRSLWTSPSVLIRAESRPTSVRRSLFADTGVAKVDDVTGGVKVETLRRVQSSKLLGPLEKSEMSPTKFEGQAALGSSTIPAGTETLSAELALKLASRRKWEV